MSSFKWCDIFLKLGSGLSATVKPMWVPPREMDVSQTGPSSIETLLRFFFSHIASFKASQGAGCQSHQAQQAPMPISEYVTQCHLPSGTLGILKFIPEKLQVIVFNDMLSHSVLGLRMINDRSQFYI